MASTLVSFFNEAIKNEFKSKEAGRPIYDDVLHIRKVVAGSRGEEIVNLATDDDKEAYPDEYKRFEDRESGPARHGTPLEELPGVPASFVKEMAGFQVKTVEEMAEVSDAQLSFMGPGAREKHDLAKAWLERSQGGQVHSQATARVAELESENEALKRQVADGSDAQAQIAELKKKLAEAEDEIEQLTAPEGGSHDRDQSPGRPRGRPRKDASNT